MTVVIPAYNRAATIAGAVSSALKQTPHGPAEVIVVDDCSADETADIAQRAGAHVIRHDVNRGPGAARNTAIARARQPWIAFLDSDDEWLPHHLDSVWNARGDHVLVSGAALRCQSDGRDRYIGTPQRGGMVVRSPAQVATLPMTNTSGMLVRREVVQAAGGFRPLYGAEDIDLWLRILEHGTGYLSPVVSSILYVHPVRLSINDLALQADRREVLRAYSDRSWFTPQLVSNWETSMTWDIARVAARNGDRAQAARHLARIAVSPARMRALAGVLLWRWRGRRRTSRIARSGAPTLAIVGPPRSKRAPEVELDLTPYEVLTPPGAITLMQYLSLARRPAAALLVTRRADRLVARLLGMHPVAHPHSRH